jgi:hypothetical protein
MWVAIHKCTEATLGIFLYSYLYSKLAKMLCLSYYLYVFSSTKVEKKRTEPDLPGSRGLGVGLEVGGRCTNNVYT